MYFLSRPRKVAELSGGHLLMTPSADTDQLVETTALGDEYSTETFLRPPLRSLPLRKKQRLKTKDPAQALPLGSSPGHSLSLLISLHACFSQTLTDPTRLATRGAMGSGLLAQANLQSWFKVPFSLTSETARAAQPRLSCYFFYAKPFLVSLSPTLINLPSYSPGLVLGSFSCTRSWTHTGRPSKGQIRFLVISHEIKLYIMPSSPCIF